MDKEKIIKLTADKVKQEMLQAEGSHDWWHVYRVWKMTKKIAQLEKADSFIAELSALLHDLKDWKTHSEEEGPQYSYKWLISLEVDDQVANEVKEILSNLSFKGAKVKAVVKTKAGQIVQDADRLDALGAIGIGRAFSYGGKIGRQMYNPEKSPQEYEDATSFKNSNSPTLNHFPEKLFLLKDLMNTDTGKKIAIQRDKFLYTFYDEFLSEWEGKK